MATVLAGAPLHGQPQAEPNAATQEAGSDASAGTPPPVIVKVFPTFKAQQETTDEKAERASESNANWWMVRLTGVLALIGLLQTFVFGWQARRLKQTIDKMDEIAGGQTGDMQASIGQATRAANAMADVATAMGENVASVKESVATSKEIAGRQKQMGELQLRAYISAVIGGGLCQDRANGIKFQGNITIVNDGQTPAHKVIHHINAGIFPVPLPEGFEFPILGVVASGENMIGPRQHRTLSGVLDSFVPDDEVEPVKQPTPGRGLYVWGKVNYTDVFENLRETTFCLLVTWLPNGTVWGYYTPNRNNAT
ncbi:MAG TPA: hypothetical protein VHY79_16940 [Rhizomicrobium sp.]|nr:hypothetical protein [Rhizomicrobium sp.]